MTVLRSLLFAVVAVTAMLVVALACLPLLVVAPRAAGGVPRGFGGFVVGLLQRLCGVHVEITGMEHLENGPVLIAAKHQSALETYLLCHRLPQARFVLKREIVLVPLVGWFVAAMRPIAVDRGAGAAALRGLLQRARQAVAEGCSVVIFPEGTRTRPGEIVPYQPGVAALYADLGLPVVPLALDTGHAWPRRSLVKYPGRATLAFLEPIPPGLPRRDFMTLLQERIEAGCRALESARNHRE